MGNEDDMLSDALKVGRRFKHLLSEGPEVIKLQFRCLLCEIQFEGQVCVAVECRSLLYLSMTEEGHSCASSLYR